MIKIVFFGHCHVPADNPVHTQIVHKDMATNLAIVTNTMFLWLVPCLFEQSVRSLHVQKLVVLI